MPTIQSKLNQLERLLEEHIKPPMECELFIVKIVRENPGDLPLTEPRVIKRYLCDHKHHEHSK